MFLIFLCWFPNPKTLFGRYFFNVITACKGHAFIWMTFSECKNIIICIIKLWLNFFTLVLGLDFLAIGFPILVTCRNVVFLCTQTEQILNIYKTINPKKKFCIVKLVSTNLASINVKNLWLLFYMVNLLHKCRCITTTQLLILKTNSILQKKKKQCNTVLPNI